ncbi:unnamed protein product [Spirodela intermedia]|uniref:TF-B3 domain-containing protein n=1 Tax=Spirodela intermedia TaxID=51605 RepID=A0A7I8JFJ8_SPIIN|nr:unnamed protein product [Spirodela intermedia]CAA6668172.1 unnamed protein product [Spirodela intermedia]
MMLVEGQDGVERQEGKHEGVGLYPGQEINGEDEVQKGSLGVAEDEDAMMAEIETDLIFSDDAFPSLPDFPCLPLLPWALGGQDHQQHAEGQTSSSVVGDVPVTLPSTPSDRRHPLDSLASDCSMYQFAGMDLLGSADESWDPLSLFPDDEETNNMDGDESTCNKAFPDAAREELIQQQHHRELRLLTLEEGNGGDKEAGGCASQELAMVFLEWLRDNKETISPQDLRSIKLRRSTIDCAVRSLGGGKDGMKKLLKLILTWVQNNHLQKKRHPVSGPHEGLFQTPARVSFPSPLLAPPSKGLVALGRLPRPLRRRSSILDVCFDHTPFHSVLLASVIFPRCGAHLPLVAGAASIPVFSTSPHPAPSLYTSGVLPGQYAVGHLFHQGPGESLVRLASSATKEARKKRMARQRRFSSLHHNHNHHHHHQRNQHHQSTHDQHQHQIHLQQCAPTLPGEGRCSQMNSHGSWTFRPSTSPSSQQVVETGGATATTMPQQRQHDFPPGSTADRRQSEKNLRFLLQKVLKQSDVGSLGRIVLPKKEAETHLPELETRDGISIVMEDIVTSRSWNMRYRFWPNNKSRMYLLENTGDFVRSNGLQEGDFIVIYSDIKCGKYMIRGVKVRQSIDPNVSGNNSQKHNHLGNSLNGGSDTKNNKVKSDGGCTNSSRIYSKVSENRNEHSDVKVSRQFDPTTSGLHTTEAYIYDAVSDGRLSTRQ